MTFGTTFSSFHRLISVDVASAFKPFATERIMNYGLRVVYVPEVGNFGVGWDG